MVKNKQLGPVEQFEKLYVRPRAGRTLVVGSHVYPGREDRRFRYTPRAEGWDMLDGEGVDKVVNLELEQALPPVYTHIDCVSVLEHTPHPWLVAENIVNLLTGNGSLYVASPFIWRVHNYPHDFWRFTIDGIRQLFGPQIIWMKLMYVHAKLTEEDEKIPSTKIKDHPYHARTEVCGFGRRLI